LRVVFGLIAVKASSNRKMLQAKFRFGVKKMGWIEFANANPPKAVEAAHVEGRPPDLDGALRSPDQGTGARRSPRTTGASEEAHEGMV
jgi:hypothetical protein